MSENNVVAPVKKLRSVLQIAQSIKLGNNSQESKRNKKEKMNKININNEERFNNNVDNTNDNKINTSNCRIYDKYIYITVASVGLIGIIYYIYKYNIKDNAIELVKDAVGIVAHVHVNTDVKIKSNIKAMD